MSCNGGQKCTARSHSTRRTCIDQHTWQKSATTLVTSLCKNLPLLKCRVHSQPVARPLCWQPNWFLCLGGCECAVKNQYARVSWLRQGGHRRFLHRPSRSCPHCTAHCASAPLQHLLRPSTSIPAAQHLMISIHYLTICQSHRAT